MYCYNKKRERTHHQWTAHPSADFHYGFWLLALILSSVTVCFTLWPDPQLESSGTGGTRLDGDFKGEMSWQFCVPNNAHPPDANLPSGHVVGAVTWDIEGHVRWALAGVEVPGGHLVGLLYFLGQFTLPSCSGVTLSKCCPTQVWAVSGVSGQFLVPGFGDYLFMVVGFHWQGGQFKFQSYPYNLCLLHPTANTSMWIILCFCFHSFTCASRSAMLTIIISQLFPLYSWFLCYIGWSGHSCALLRIKHSWWPIRTNILYCVSMHIDYVLCLYYWNSEYLNNNGLAIFTSIVSGWL